MRHAKSVETGNPSEWRMTDLRRPADQITLPKIAIFVDGKSFAMQNTSHLESNLMTQYSGRLSG